MFREIFSTNIEVRFQNCFFIYHFVLIEVHSIMVLSIITMSYNKTTFNHVIM